ncbi:MAG: helix-turn-helix transcriptional regulator [Sphingobacteriales bacterium]|nr:helix-turn-helix transcriptional regulator [Sphingobacteriales bacterium]
MAELLTAHTLTVVSENDSSAEIKVDYLAIKKAAVVLRAINHKLRQQILHLIEENKRMTVTEIYVQLRLEQSVASQHLAIMRRAGIVKTTREGKFIWYSVNTKRLQEISKFVSDLLG